MTLTATFDEKAVLTRLQQGDGKAFDEIYAHFWQGLYHKAYNRVRNKEVCQDLVQELFLDVWKRRDRLLTDNLSAYLHAAIQFLCYRQLSKSSHKNYYFQELEDVLQAATRTDGPVIEKELKQLLDFWIATLPTKRREIFLLHYMEGLNTAEIAEKIGISRKTVQNQLNTAYTEIHQKYAHFLSVIVILSGFHRDL